MALFADSMPATIEDLTDQDSGLLDVAQTTGINLTTKLRLAKEDIGTDLRLWLSPARFWSEMVWMSRPRIEQVVVTPFLTRWHAMQALALVYRDAYFSQLVDRYQARWTEYSQRAKDAREEFIAQGISMVVDPVIQASSPLLATIAAPETGGTFYSAVTWVNASGQEGAPSLATGLSLPDGYVMTLSSTEAPANVVGFNAYVGTTPDTMLRQNSSAVSIGSAVTYIPGLTNGGPRAGSGQQADFVRPIYRELRRG